MKNTKYLVAGVWCALLVGFVAARSTTALAAAGAVGVLGSPSATSGHGQFAYSSGDVPVLLADDSSCDWENFTDTGCDGNYICTTGYGDDSGTCVLPQSYSPTSGGSGSAGTDGEIGGSCDQNAFAGGCDTGLTCDSSGTCVSSSSGNSGSDGEAGGACSPDEFPNSGGCDPSANLTCNGGTCVPANPVDSSCTKNSDCNTGDVCDLGLDGGSCTDASTDGGAGAACSSSADCGYDLMCSTAQNECVADNCSTAGASCGVSGETCQSVSGVGASNPLQCGGTGSSGGGSKPKTPGGTPGSGKTGTSGTGSTTKRVNGASSTAPGSNGSTNILNSSGQVIGNAPAGSTVSINPATGQATITTPNSSTSSPGSNSGIGTTPDVCGAGLGAFDSISLFPKICNFNDLVLAVVNVLLSVLAIIAALFIIIGGFRYVTSNGNEEGAKKGLATVKNAAIGLGIAILAYAIIAVVTNTVSGLSASSSTSNSSGTTTTSSGATPG